MHKFRRQIIGTLSTVVTITILVLITITYNSFKAETIKQTKALLREENRSIETELVEKFNAYRRELSAISVSSDEIARPSLSEKVITQLNVIYNTQKEISNGVYLFLENGDIYNRNGTLLDVNVKHLNRSYYNAIFNQGKRFYVSAPYISSSNGKQVFGVAYKISDNLAILSSIYTDVVLGPLANQRGMFMYTDDGTILSSQYPELLGKNIFKQRPAYKQFSEDTPEIIYQVATNNVESDYIAFWAKLDINGWGYVTFVENKHIHEAADDQLRSALLVSIIGVLIVILILLFIINTLILKPIGGAPKEIATLMDDVAQGKLNPKLTHPSGKETGIYRSLIILSTRVSELTLDKATSNAEKSYENK